METTAEEKFAVGDWVRLNRMGSRPERVISVIHPMVNTAKGGSYHHTKVRLVKKGKED